MINIQGLHSIGIPSKMAATWLLVVGLIIQLPTTQSIKAVYNMDTAEDCGFVGAFELKTGESVTLNGKSTPSSSVMTCQLKFKVADSRDDIDINFSSFFIDDCDVIVFISMEGTSTGRSSYSCGSPPPGTQTSTTGAATVRLDRKYITSVDYDFSFTLRAYKPADNYDGANTSPVPVGMVVGIVGGIVGLLVIFAIIGVCCYRRKRRYEKGQREQEYKENLDADSNTTYGYDNTGRNGTVYHEDTPGSNKKLLFDDKRDFDDRKYREENEVNSSNSSGERKAPLIESYSMSPKKSMTFDYDGKKDPESDTPKSPMLNALQSNPKFRKSFADNEADAEERAKRISSYSSGPDSPTEAPMEQTRVKRGVTAPPPLPNVPKSPVAKRSAFASIRRAPRPSSSSEEIQQIQQGSRDHDDRDIRIIRDRDDPPSPSEVVPIKVSDPHQSKARSDTQHTLRPNRGKSPKDKRKAKPSRDDDYENYSAPPRDEREPERKTKGNFQKNSSLRKSSRKSPRVGRGSRPSIGSILDDNESIGRPDTPNSQVSRFTRDDDDLDSNYQPLRRSASRQSLYASRSSLYGRRGKRDRRGSFSESVMSYARDDIDAYSERDFDERRVSRRESMRKNYRSLGDLEYEAREISTQTLRETASQTRGGRVTPTKKGASKKVAARKNSTSSTASKKPRAKKPSTKSGDEDGEEEADTKSTTSTPKTKSKSASQKPKPQPKPRPAPRKSTGAKSNPGNDTVSELDQSEAPAYTAASGVPYGMPPGARMPYPGVPGQPQFVARGPGGVPMMHPYPGVYPGGYPGVYPGQPQMMYAPVARMPNAAPPQAPPQARPQAPRPSEGAAGKSGKSSWDILCAMTDHEKVPSDELASVTGSVFSHQQPDPYSAVQYPPQGVPYQPAYPPSGTMSYVPNSYMPVMSGTTSEFGSGPYPASTTSSHSSEDVKPVVVLPKTDKVFPRQASWEVLNEMASSEKNKTQSHKTESIV